MARRFKLTVWLGLAFCGPESLAQEPPYFECEESDTRCAAERSSRLLQIFGVPSIETHLSRGEQVRRIFVLNHFAMPVAAISFVRAPRRAPELLVHFPRRQGEVRAPLQRTLSAAFWNDVLQRSRRLDVPLDVPPVTPDDGEDISICLDSWTRVLEASDPQTRGEPAVRRATVEGCRASPASDFALAFERAVVPLFSPCQRVEMHGFYGYIGTCGRLYGDQMVAADAFSRALDFTDPMGRDLASFFRADAQIAWSGEAVRSGPRQAAEFWREREPLVDSVRVEGLGANSARLTGFVYRYVDGPESSERIFDEAPLEALWVRNPGELFQIERITIGAWSPRR